MASTTFTIHHGGARWQQANPGSKFNSMIRRQYRHLRREFGLSREDAKAYLVDMIHFGGDA